MNTKVTFGLLAGCALLFSAQAQTSVDSVITNGLWEPHSVVANASGDIYVSDGANHRIVKYNQTSGQFTTLAGLLGVGGTNNGTGINARFGLPQGMIAARGGLVVADYTNHLIRYVGFNGVVTNIAGAPTLSGNVNAVGGAARFRYPVGLAADSSGNIFVADTKNNAIRKIDPNDVVTTAVSNLWEPAAVVVGATNELWVADTRNHVIRVVPPGSGQGTIVAGSYRVAGTNDSIFASQALFNLPRGLAWLGPSVGLLIADTGNNSIRRLYWNPEIGGYSMETVAGVSGQAGFANGSATAARFSAPIGVVQDPFFGGFLVADRGNNLVRRIATGPIQPPVSDPMIGWVEYVDPNGVGWYWSRLNQVIVAIFNNAVNVQVLAERETQTYYTYGPTPANQYEDTIPAPGPTTGYVAPFYADGMFSNQVPATILSVAPDVTIKAISSQPGRRSSQVVQARFIFKTGTPTIQGDNAASFVLGNPTFDCEMWYTLDGTDPTNGPPSFGPVSRNETVSFFVGETNVTFKARAYREHFAPSDIITKVFVPDEFHANTISFGFASGEASSAFIGSAGQRFYAPVTLTAVPDAAMYSLQFNVMVTNKTGSPSVDGGKVGFESMLLKKINDVFYVIPPAMAIADATAVYTNLLFTNSSINLLGVGWLERYRYTNLYDTLAQDLITYSQAHDTTFLSSEGKVILGGYSFVVPGTSVPGNKFSISINRASATADGISKDVYIDLPTNGVLLARREVEVGERRYTVGDVAPFRWFNAGDFGNSNILNNDVLQVFQSAVYYVNMPPEGSDFEDSLNSCCANALNVPLASDILFDGDDTTINQIVFGDTDIFGRAMLDVADVFVTFRRSLDPSLKWFARYWSGGTRQFVEVPNVIVGPGGVTNKAASAKPASGVVSAKTISSPSAAFSAGDVVAAGQGVIQIPIRANIRGGRPLRVLLMNLTVQPLEGAPAVTVPVQFTPGSALGAPTLTMSRSAANFSAAWLNETVAGINGSNVIGTLTITLPPGAPVDAAYRIHFDHLSGSPNGLGVFPSQLTDGLVTFRDRSASSWGDGIPDSWRLRYFGSLGNLLSASNADADGDGSDNWSEFRAGTNPNDVRSRLQLLSNAVQGGGQPGVRLQWPTGLNRRYVLERAPYLGSTNWTSIATNLIGDGTLQEFTDNMPGSSVRFYRVRVAE